MPDRTVALERRSESLARQRARPALHVPVHHVPITRGHEQALDTRRSQPGGVGINFGTDQDHTRVTAATGGRHVARTKGAEWKADQGPAPLIVELAGEARLDACDTRLDLPIEAALRPDRAAAVAALLGARAEQPT